MVAPARVRELEVLASSPYATCALAEILGVRLDRRGAMGGRVEVGYGKQSELRS